MRAKWMIGGGLLLALGPVVGSCSDSDSTTASGGTGATSTGGGGAAGSSSGGSSSAGSGGSGLVGGGGGQGASGGQGGQAGGGGEQCTDLGDDCTTCLLLECQADYCECWASPECQALAVCVQLCSDQDCVQGCWTDHPDGISDLFILSDCADQECPLRCPFGTDLGPCSLCMFSRCEAQANDCFAVPECADAVQCAQACDPGDLTCWQGCAAAGGDEAQEVLTCVLDQCSPECGF